MPDLASKQKHCPGSTCQTGAAWPGKIKKDGIVAFLSSKLELDEAAAAEFLKLGEPGAITFSVRPLLETGANSGIAIPGIARLLKGSWLPAWR